MEEQYRRAEGSLAEELESAIAEGARMARFALIAGFISGLLIGGGAVALLMA
jgi:hypothetical protein